MRQIPVIKYEPLKAEIKAFVNSIANNLPVPVSGEDGVRALKIALALKESAEKNIPIII